MSFIRATEIDNFQIGSFINTGTGAEVTTGTVTGTYIKDGVAGVLSGTITYNATVGTWIIDKITATEADALILGLKFTLVNCTPIVFTIKTDVTSALTITPLSIAVPSGQVTSHDLIAYLKASFSFTFTVVDANDQPVILTSKSLEFVVHDTSLNTIFALTTGAGQITVANGNQVTVASSATNTQLSGRNKWVLRNITDSTVLSVGTITIVPVGGP